MAENYEMEESETSESPDRLSELPHSLIFHIFSFLPMKYVVSTTLLSKRWKNLWTTSPCLDFSDFNEEEDDYADRFRNFVNRALIFWKGAKIMMFTIDYESHFDMSLAKDLDVWVCFAKENYVEELNIDLTYHPQALLWDNAITESKEDIYRAPECLNSLSSIKTLSLVGCNLRIPNPPSWNQLKSLRIDGFCFSEGLINRVLYGAPQLEVFILRLLESHENLSIYSSSLKYLKIEKYLYFGDVEKPSTETRLRIECPNLEMLEIWGILYSKYVLRSVSSVTDVTLMFDGSDYYDHHRLPGKELLGETLRHFFSAIRLVENVTLSPWCVQVLGASQNKNALPPLSNVKYLEFEVLYSNQLDEMVHLLGVFPNVEALVIKEHTSYGAPFSQESVKNLPKSFLLQLRTVEITSLLYYTSIFVFIEMVLKHASMLEKMVIRANAFELLSKERLFVAAEKLLSMPRSSTTAKVIFQKIEVLSYEEMH